MAESPEFEKFPRIPRLFRDIEITEKIDGSNAQIIIPDDESAEIAVGSRNRYITPGKTTDNFGFAAWVLDNSAALRRLGPGKHYGEWFGAGIGRRYGMAGRAWALFSQRGLPVGLPDNVMTVPLLYAGPWEWNYNNAEVLQNVLLRLEFNGSVAVPGFMEPEGVVVFHKASGKRFKYTFGGDAKSTPSPEEL